MTLTMKLWWSRWTVLLQYPLTPLLTPMWWRPPQDFKNQRSSKWLLLLTQTIGSLTWMNSRQWLNWRAILGHQVVLLQCHMDVIDLQHSGSQQQHIRNQLCLVQCPNMEVMPQALSSVLPFPIPPLMQQPHQSSRHPHLCIPQLSQITNQILLI